MLSLFPELLMYPLVAATLLRIVTGIYFGFLGARLVTALRTVSHPSWEARIFGGLFATSQLVVSALLIVGAYTQGAALGGITLAVLSIVTGVGRGKHPSERHMHMLLLVSCLSILFLGAGLFAFDLPI